MKGVRNNFKNIFLSIEDKNFIFVDEAGFRHVLWLNLEEQKWGFFKSNAQNSRTRTILIIAEKNKYGANNYKIIMNPVTEITFKEYVENSRHKCYNLLFLTVFVLEMRIRDQLKI